MKPTTSSRSGSFFVALGILLSRISGLVRERVFAHYFGNSDAGDAFKAGLKIPNFLQNLFGEGVLSASFIPVYSKLLASGERDAARRVAWSIGGFLALVVSGLVLAGVLATPFLIDAIAPGFEGEKRELTIRVVRVLFPGTGALVLSAWCLGILNSHRQFFLSYSAPVLWNVAIIATIVWFGAVHGQEDLAIDAAWGLFVGSLLQFGVQLPFVVRWIGATRRARPEDQAAVRGIVRSFFPVVVGRGVVQISAYVDNVIASLLPTGAVSALAYAQTLYLLPVSLFGMSVTAAELPELSAVAGEDEVAREKLRARLEGALARMAFFIIPSAVAFLLLGDVIAGAIFQTGEFKREDALLVWAILAGAAVGLVPATRARLTSSAFYALRDVKTPLRMSIVRIVLSIALGLVGSLLVPKWLGIAAIYGTVGIAATGGLGNWVEYLLLKGALERRIGRIKPPTAKRRRVWVAAVLAGALAFAAKVGLYDPASPIATAILIIGVFGAVYFVAGALMGLDEARRVVARFGFRIS